MRFFNTRGPVVAADHYLIPPLERLNRERVQTLIEEKAYFVVQAPRQTGKTTALLALRDFLNRRGYHCTYVNFEVGSAAGEDAARAMRAVLGQIASQARSMGDGFVARVWSRVLTEYGPDMALGELLARWSEVESKPLVLLIDEIDALAGNSLYTVVRQLRAGYAARPKSLPHGIVLCGLRDTRDYPLASGASPFNMTEALRLGDFSRTETLALLGQHTAETGQKFSAKALDAVFSQTQGQPWLVNALARDVCFRSDFGRDRSREITATDIHKAREQLIVRRETHLDQLADKLQEDRVRRVVAPLLSEDADLAFSTRDIDYVRDLGLIARDDPLRIANPIYAEVIPRELAYPAQGRARRGRGVLCRGRRQLEPAPAHAGVQVFFRMNAES